MIQLATLDLDYSNLDPTKVYFFTCVISASEIGFNELTEIEGTIEHIDYVLAIVSNYLAREAIEIKDISLTIGRKPKELIKRAKGDV